MKDNSNNTWAYVENWLPKNKEGEFQVRSQTYEHFIGSDPSPDISPSIDDADDYFYHKNKKQALDSLIADIKRLLKEDNELWLDNHGRLCFHEDDVCTQISFNDSIFKKEDFTSSGLSAECLNDLFKIISA